MDGCEAKLFSLSQTIAETWPIETSQVSLSSWEPEEPDASVGMMKSGLKAEWSVGGGTGERRNRKTDPPGQQLITS